MNPKAPSSKNTASDARAAARAGLNRARAGLEARKGWLQCGTRGFNHSADSDKSGVPSTRDSHAAEVADLTRQAEERAAARQHKNDKLTARERLETLLDPDTFVEIGQFMGGSMKNGFTETAVITGHGEINGRRVAVFMPELLRPRWNTGSRRGSKDHQHHGCRHGNAHPYCRHARLWRRTHPGGRGCADPVRAYFP